MRIAGILGLIVLGWTLGIWTERAAIMLHHDNWYEVCHYLPEGK